MNIILVSTAILLRQKETLSLGRYNIQCDVSRTLIFHQIKCLSLLQSSTPQGSALCPFYFPSSSASQPAAASVLPGWASDGRKLAQCSSLFLLYFRINFLNTGSAESSVASLKTPSLWVFSATLPFHEQTLTSRWPSCTPVPVPWTISFFCVACP